MKETRNNPVIPEITLYYCPACRYTSSEAKQVADHMKSCTDENPILTATQALRHGARIIEGMMEKPFSVFEVTR